MRLAKTIWESQNKVGDITRPNIKTYYIATIIKTVVLAEVQSWGPMEQNSKYSQLIGDSFFNKWLLDQLDINSQKKKKRQEKCTPAKSHILYKN